MRARRRLAKRARSIFEDLGYDVEGAGARPEFRARRAWKSVTVTAVAAGGEGAPPNSGELRCFVTDGDPDALRRRLRRREPEYEYAIISVEDDDYEVVRAPPVGR
jgi:hypothetical protein